MHAETAQRSERQDTVIAGQPLPEKGTGATIHLRDGDRQATTIIEVWETGAYRYVVVQRDHAEQNIGCMPGYQFERNENGGMTTYRQREDGKGWRRVTMKPNGNWLLDDDMSFLVIGTREEGRDR